ncbi:MAG: HD domain-containing phosphohydrolase, partial [Bacillota bacterium]
MIKFDLNISRVLEILLRALDYIDVRLVDHGHRVSYILYKMMQADGSYQKKEMQEICIIAALHDIGAYKTEEIDHMMRFESQDVFDHSIYGYLFLKHMSPLSKWADIVLYHHLNYGEYNKLNSEYLKIADMIHLADKIDVVLQIKGEWLGYKELLKQQDIMFGRSSIELFEKANLEYDIKGNILNGSYLKDLSSFVSTAAYDDQTLLDYFKMIACSIDFRSETTVNHVITTVSISTELGKLLGLEEEDLRKIKLGAYLHDIGKISTPLGILEKQGSLTTDEMSVMQQHIEITGQILKDRINEDVFRIAYHHHEKMDGSGYPLRLKEEQLSLSEKIVAVADIISALTGK